VGLNGAGKSTLLKTLSQQLPAVAGELSYGHEVSSGYYAQHVGEALAPTSTVFECLQSKASHDTPTQDILDLAGSLLFSGADIHKKVSVLSGGEKARVALGQVLLERRPFLILDEPTNHLDFYTVEALTQALTKFEGTLIVVSHDQGFIKRVATKIVEIKSGTIRSYPGTYEDYVWSLSQQLLNNEPTQKVSKIAPGETSASETKSDTQLSREARKKRDTRLRQIRKQLDTLPALISKKQNEVLEINNRLAVGQQTPELFKALEQGQKVVEDLESEWLRLAEELEELE
jgi:ATP-binding cassette subfamily F protein 3